MTGPIGSGKDEVAKILKRRGAFVIDADEAAHTLYKPQAPVWHELLKTFGSKIMVRGGKINRKKLAEIVFSDKKLLQKLNEIVHPYLKEEIIKIVDSRKSKVENRAPIVINAAVLKEIGLLDVVDEIWVVAASKKTRLKRSIKNGLSKPEALKRMNSQTSQKDYLKMADVVIKNDGSKENLAKKALIYYRKFFE